MNERPRPSSIIWQEARQRIEALKNAPVTENTRRNVSQALARAESAITHALEELAAIERDKNLSPVGKRSRGQPIVDAALRDIELATSTVASQLKQERATLEERAAWPRSEGTDADREARLGNARADLHRLLENVPSDKIAERLRFAADNGTPAMRELILGEKYPERILFPMLGREATVAAVDWSLTRPDAVARLHPGGESVQTSLAALAALDAGAGQVPEYVHHAVDMDSKELLAAVERLGPQPDPVEAA